MSVRKPFISLTSDFGVQSQGVGIMEAVAWEICPEAKVVHLMHGLPDFDITMAARTMETAAYLPVGCHVCVVDPGVGTKRRGIIIKVKRGDYLIGPDNGALVPATRFLGGIEKVVVIENPKYMRQPVSPIFHGRDVFTPAAAHLACGVPIEEFGTEVAAFSLAAAPYEEAIFKDGTLHAQVISINKFGSAHLNVMHAQWDEFGVLLGHRISIEVRGNRVELLHVTTFGDITKGNSLIMKDDYGRIEVAINQGSFVERYSVEMGDRVIMRK